MISDKQHKTIDDYIAACPKDVRGSLRKLRETIKAEAPGVSETIKYRMPTFVLNGRNLVHFAVLKDHIGFYPTPGPIVAFRKELADYGQSKGAIRFPRDKSLPFALIRKIVRFRIKQENERARKKK
ncbi:MAG: iron chaperone [Candidatus Saccharibacteria bacterium]